MTEKNPMEINPQLIELISKLTTHRDHYDAFINDPKSYISKAGLKLSNEEVDAIINSDILERHSKNVNIMRSVYLSQTPIECSAGS